jgi:hypothetical protein
MIYRIYRMRYTVKSAAKAKTPAAALATRGDAMVQVRKERVERRPQESGWLASDFS